MTLRIPEGGAALSEAQRKGITLQCGDCTKPTCVCRDCDGNQAPYCLDYNGNPCTFDGTLSCKWYQQNMVTERKVANV